MSSVVQIMAAALAQELRERDIATIGAPISEQIIETVIKRSGEACGRLLAAKEAKDISRRDI